MSKWLNKIRQRLSPYFHRKRGFISSERKLISFTFDDVPRSAFNQAVSELGKYNANGTFYIALSFMEGESNGEALYDSEDLKKCLARGNELGCHTYGHLHFKRTGSKEYIFEDLTKNQSVLNDRGFDEKFQNFAYPFGEQTVKSRKIVSGRFLTSRGLSPGVNVGKVDFNYLKAIRLYENYNSLEDIYQKIEDFNRKGGWLIFVAHDIQKDYSRFGCSQAYFNSVLRKCVDMNIEIKTVKDALLVFNEIELDS